MLRATAIGALLFLACARCASSANPSDIHFAASLVNNSNSFHIGERIKLEFSYSTESVKKYQGSFFSFSCPVDPHPVPANGFINLKESRIEAGSFAGSNPVLGSQPYKRQTDLNICLRFQTPGHYSVSFTTEEVSRMKGPEEGGGLERITLESDPIELDILPDDPSWNANELETIRQDLASSDPSLHQAALEQLGYLDSPASVEVLFHLYLSNSDPDTGLVERGLLETSHLELAISLMHAALSDPSVEVPEALPRHLADLQVRLKLAPESRFPHDSARQEEWRKQDDVRNEMYAEYLAQANTLLLASVEHRSGAFRARAIYGAWLAAEQLNQWKSEGPDSLLSIRRSVIDVAGDLDLAEMAQVLVSEWPKVPHEQLLPIVLSLTKDPSNGDPEIFKLFCEGWPRDCDAAILTGIQHSSLGVVPEITLLLPESEHQ